MHYLITEDEFNRLEGVMRQLGFIYDLCSQNKADDFQQIDVRGLLAFCEAQESSIRQMVEAATERDREAHELARSNGAMSPADWMHALRIASGDDRHTPRGAVETITRKLTMTMLADPDMQMVQSEWVKLLVEQGDLMPPISKPKAAEASAPVVRASKSKGAKTAQAAKPKVTQRKHQKLVEGALS